jgi:hypothetical protein
MKLLLLALTVIITACNSNNSPELPPLPFDPGSGQESDGNGSGNPDEENLSLVNWDELKGDLQLLHLSGSGLRGGDLSGNVLVFSDMTPSGDRLLRKDLNSDLVEPIGVDLDDVWGSGHYWIQTGYVSMSGYDSTNFRIDQDGDYSYFTVNTYSNNQSSNILYRKRASGPSEEIINLGLTYGVSRGSITKDGRFAVISSNSSSLLGLGPDETVGSGIMNLFRINLSTQNVVPITSVINGEMWSFLARGESISDDGDEILYTVVDRQQNTYNQPAVNVSGIRSALIYQKLGADSNTIVINDVERFPENYTEPTTQRISSNGLYAAFMVANSGYSGDSEIWHFDSTQGGASGLVKLISKNEAGERILSPLYSGGLSLCDISPNGKLVAIISNNMKFMGQERQGFKQLFIKNVDNDSVQLVSAGTNGNELPANTLNCYFTEQGQSIVFTVEEATPPYRRIIFKKSLISGLLGDNLVEEQGQDM